MSMIILKYKKWNSLTFIDILRTHTYFNDSCVTSFLYYTQGMISILVLRHNMISYEQHSV